MAEPKKPKGKIRRALEKIVAGAVLLHAGTQLSYLANDLYHSARPSAVRVAFEQEFGIPLKGWASDIENKPQQITAITEALREEKTEGDLHINTIRVESPNYLKKSIDEQFYQIFTFGYSGLCIPGSGNAEIKINARDAGDIQRTVHHEAKHAKAFAVMRAHPEFLERWDALSRDGEGNSLYHVPNRLYHPPFRPIFSWLPGLHNIVQDDRSQSPTHYENLGFVSPYAMTDIDEDIAETGASAEGFVLDCLPSSRAPISDTLRKKYRLAEEYGLVPQEYNSMLNLQDLARAAWGSDQVTDATIVDSFIRSSQAFLEEHPGSRWEQDVLGTRGTLIYNLPKTVEFGQFRLIAIVDFETLLRSKPGCDYLLLEALERLHTSTGNSDAASMYTGVRLRYLAEMRSLGSQEANQNCKAALLQ